LLRGVPTLYWKEAKSASVLLSFVFTIIWTA
jgi:hypothetical protein